MPSSSPSRIASSSDLPSLSPLLDVLARAHRRLQDLEHRHAAAGLLRDQPLRDEVAERGGEPRPHGLLVAGLEGADDRARRSWRRRSCGGSRTRDGRSRRRSARSRSSRDRASRRPESPSAPAAAPPGAPSAKVGVSLCSSRWWTVALLVLVQELDRILDGEDVLGAGLVDQIDDRGERRRLAGAGRPGDQHDAVLERRRLGERPAAGSARRASGSSTR